MSLINGDKGRAGRQRKSKLAQREKNRVVRDAARAKAGSPAEAPNKVQKVHQPAAQ
jgi:hypothetical protein